MEYKKLEKSERKSIITNFLESIDEGRALANVGREYVGRFARVSLNGRQIKNTIAIATALAAAQSKDLDSSHISRALEANGKDLPVSGEASEDESDLYD